MWKFGFAMLVTTGVVSVAYGQSSSNIGDWPYYGGDAGGSRFSQVRQINTKNVHQLKIAWVYHTGDISDGTKYRRKSAFEATPILVDGTLYVSTAFNRVIALDPETGQERWSFDPKIDLNREYSEGLMNRGVSTWADGSRRRRLFIATIDARLICLEASAGKPCADFGSNGQIDLRQGIKNIIRDGEYEETSPPAVIDDLVIVGSAIADNDRAESPSGIVRAFDVRTGKLKWTWNPIPQDPRDQASRTWLGNSAERTGAANAWSVIVTDPTRHLVFIPTGSASPDYHGGARKGDNKWANSVVAIHAGTGELAWGFQLVHHDLWDYDSASPPLLATLVRGAGKIPVVIQGNKTGNLFVLNRESGEPVFPIEERPVPQSDVPGEPTSATQPFPVAPPPLTPQRIATDDAWGLTPEARQACRERIERLVNKGIFTPPTIEGSLIYPGIVGGLNWSGYAFHPKAQILVASTVRIPV
jgi:quinoprotein glucose dehydrogenase